MPSINFGGYRGCSGRRTELIEELMSDCQLISAISQNPPEHEAQDFRNLNACKFGTIKNHKPPPPPKKNNIEKTKKERKVADYVCSIFGHI